jgi:hypothetical protein
MYLKKNLKNQKKEVFAVMEIRAENAEDAEKQKRGELIRNQKTNCILY